MPSNNSVTIIVAGDDKSSAVFDAVEKHLQSLQARAQQTDETIGRLGGHSVSQMQAASASVRVLDGDFGHLMRAEERFLSMLPGVGDLMMKAFPLIGVVAVAEGIYRAGDAVYNLYEKWIDAGSAVRAYDDQLAKAADKDWANFDSLETAQERIGEITQQMRGLNAEIDHLKPGMSDYAAALTGGIGGLAMLTGDLVARKQASDQFYGDQAKLDAGRLKQLELEHKANLQLIQDDHQIAAARLSGEAAIRNREDQELKVAKENLDYQRRIADVKNQIAKDYNSRNPNSPISLIPQNAGLQDYNEQVRKIVGVASGETSKASTEAGQKAFDDMVHRMVEGDRLAEESGKRVTEELTKSWSKMYEEDERAEKEQEAQHAAATAQYVAEEKEKAAAAREVQEERIRDASDARETASRTAQFEMQMGRQSAAGRIQAIREAAEQEYQTKLDALNKIESLDSADVDNPQKVQKDLDQIKELQTKHSQEMIELDQQEALSRKNTAASYLRDILDPLMDRPKSIEDAFKKMADNILKSLQRVAENKLIDSLTSGIGGGSGRAGGATGGEHLGLPSGRQGVGGFGGAVGSLLGSLTGRSTKASNGGLSAGAGTIPDSITSGLQQGRNMPGSGGSGGIVSLITQGTPQSVDSSSSSGGSSKFEQQIISVVLKDAESLGPLTRAIGGGIQMLGSN